MTLREAEKAVLEAADRWIEENDVTLDDVGLHQAVTRWRMIKSAGKPKARCYCGKTVSIEGDHLRYHVKRNGLGHAPMVANLEAAGGKLL